MFFSWPVILLPRLASLWQDYKYGTSITRLASILPRLGLTLICIGAMLVVVHVNTIVHPFTLADNRHYVFYIFRILLGHPMVKYMATPIYFFCAWLSLGSFGNINIYYHNPVHDLYSNTKKGDYTPSKTTSMPETSNNTDKTSDPTTRSTRATIKQENQGKEQVKISFVIVWLASTTLSLITAPLVEPRYFIIPWVMWRLHVRSASLMSSVVELAWYVAVNAVTGYVFLFRGFEWPQDPGFVQRFMW